MYEWCARPPSPGRELAGGGIPEAFDDSRFARTIETNNQGERCLKCESLPAHGIEGAHADDRQLVDPGHFVGGGRPIRIGGTFFAQSDVMQGRPRIGIGLSSSRRPRMRGNGSDERKKS
jgi:hypothetical protein